VNVSIVEVAERAGVGKSTVSRVLTGHPDVRPETRARIEVAMREMGYRPNGVARAFVTGRTHMVGLILLNLHNPFFALLAQGAEIAARARGYNVLIMDSSDSITQQQDCLAMLAERRVDGILIVPLHPEHDALDALRRAGMKMVLLNAIDGDDAIPSVSTDNVRGGRLATQHLLGLGHRRIAYVGHRRTMAGSQERLYGYRLAHTEGTVTLDPALVIEDIPGLEAVRGALHQLLDLPDPPTALFMVNDEFAMAALQALAERGLRVPDDIALVGHDDIPVAAWLTVPLTTVAQPIEEKGRIAANVLIDQIEQPTLPVQHVVLQPHLVVRQSCGAPGGCGRR